MDKKVTDIESDERDKKEKDDDIEILYKNSPLRAKISMT